MVNVPNLDSDLSTSAEFASSASRTLYGIMDSFQSAPISVRELSRDLLILMEAIGGLSGMCDLFTNTESLDLRFILVRCGVACEEFKELVRKCLPYPDDGSVDRRCWTRLRYMGGNLDTFRRLLLVYQSAFEVTVASTHLFSRLQSFVGVESLESHKTRIKHAKSDIEDFVENLDYEICPHELKQLEEQRLGIDKCLEICTYSFDSIDLIQVKTEENGKVSEADKPTAFPGLYEKGSFSTINNYSTGDAVVFMVSTDERTIHGSNKMLGWRSRYLTGHVNDQSVQQISKDFALMNTGHLERKESSAGKSTFVAADNPDSCHPETRYVKQYGKDEANTAMNLPRAGTPLTDLYTHQFRKAPHSIVENILVNCIKLNDSLGRYGHRTKQTIMTTKVEAIQSFVDDIVKLQYPDAVQLIKQENAFSASKGIQSRFNETVHWEIIKKGAELLDPNDLPTSKGPLDEFTMAEKVATERFMREAG